MVETLERIIERGTEVRIEPGPSVLDAAKANMAAKGTAVPWKGQKVVERAPIDGLHPSVLEEWGRKGLQVEIISRLAVGWALREPEQSSL